MDLQALSKIKSKFVAREVGNELVLVPLTNNVAQMNELFTLNETAKFIWENANGTVCVEDMVKLMTDNFVIDEATATNDLNTLLAHFSTLLIAK